MINKLMLKYITFFERYILLLLAFVFNCTVLQAQSTGIAEVDSLILTLKTTTNDTARVDALNRICWKLRNSDPFTSADYGDSAIAVANNAKYTSGMCKALSFTGVAYRNQGNYVKALQYYFMALDSAAKYNDIENKGYNLINIGNAYIYENKEEEGLPYLLEAIDVATSLGNKNMEAYARLNIGRIKLNLGHFEEAIPYLQKTLEIRKEIGDEGGVAVCYNYIGKYFYEKQNYRTALQNYQRCYQLSIGINEDFDLIADVLNRLAQCYIQLDEWEKAEKNAKHSLYIAKSIGTKYRIKIAYQSLAQIYDSLQNYKKAYYNFYQSTIYKDSLFDEEKERQISELATIYKTEQHKKKLEVKDLLLKKNKTQIKQQKTIIWLSVIGFFLVLFFSVLLFSMYKAKNKANNLLNKKNNDINRQKEQIMIQAKEIRKQRDKARKQRDEIIHQKQSITDSIMYAKRIQSAILPPSQYINHVIPEHAILFKPRDIVSGDFYIMLEIKNYFVFAAADCTGHGVPGAFMSMLAVSLLKDIIRKVDMMNAAQILDKLREQVISSLHQRGKSGEAHDGLDIALCILNRENEALQYAGAYNPLLIIRRKPEPHYVEIKADKMPIGIYMTKTKPFINHAIDVMPGDIFYLFSDGYIDQIGGPQGRKFMIKRFRNLLVEISHKSLQEQKEHLQKTLIDWQNHISPITNKPYSQVDDILVMALRLK